MRNIIMEALKGKRGHLQCVMCVVCSCSAAEESGKINILQSNQM